MNIVGYCTAILCLSLYAGSAQDITLSPQAPFDVAVDWDADLQEQQKAFDHFAWQQFIALNWPANDKGHPDEGRMIGAGPDNGNTTTVWEHWKPTHMIFRDYAPGEKPEWYEASIPPEPCLLQAPEVPQKAKFLTQSTKVHRDLEQVIQPFAAPIIDRNGNYARYEIVVNREAFDYIVTHDLYYKEGCDRAKEIEFPTGSMDKARQGAVIVKAAWKVLTKDDDHTRFHRVSAMLYDAKTKICKREPVGLIGMHIVVRTENAPQWVWATFEQIDNAPTLRKGKPAVKRRVRYSFYDPARKDLAFNQRPPKPWNPVVDTTNRVQIVRMNPIYKPSPKGYTNPFLFLDQQVGAMNRKYKRLLTKVNKKSVWQYYQLTGCQHNSEKPLVPGKRDERNPTGTPLPPFLANSVIETFDQGMLDDGKVKLVPQGSSSCINCHWRATVGKDSITSDFSFMLRLAKPLKKGGSK